LKTNLKQIFEIFEVKSYDTDNTDNSECNAFLGDIQGVTTLTQNTLAGTSFEPTNDDFPY
jgi:hypothetical protein